MLDNGRAAYNTVHSVKLCVILWRQSSFVSIFLPSWQHGSLLSMPEHNYIFCLDAWSLHISSVSSTAICFLISWTAGSSISLFVFLHLFSSKRSLCNTVMDSYCNSIKLKYDMEMKNSRLSDYSLKEALWFDTEIRIKQSQDSSTDMDSVPHY